MQMTVTTSLQQSQLTYSQLTLNQSASDSGQWQPAPLQDRIELSNKSKRPHDAEHEVKHAKKAHHGQNGSQLFDFLKDIIEQISGSTVHNIQGAPAANNQQVPPTQQSQQTAVSGQQANLSIEASSFSVDGSITTADGVKLAFSLDLQVIHASVSASAFNLSKGSDGYNFNFSGNSAELTSTSFSFSLAAELPDGSTEPGGGVGTFSLKDNLKEIQHAMKPLIKAFLNESGASSDTQSINQLLSTRA